MTLPALPASLLASFQPGSRLIHASSSLPAFCGKTFLYTLSILILFLLKDRRLEEIRNAACFGAFQPSIQAGRNSFFWRVE